MITVFHENERDELSNRILESNMSQGSSEIHDGKLSSLFNTGEDLFKNASLVYQPFGEQSICQIQSIHNTFLLPAERAGLNLFYRELGTRRTALLHHASRESIDLHELLRDVIQSRYALPIADYINWLNQLGTSKRAR